ncbi:glycoside hydrolase family 88 protein [Flavivirga spongiicola]|uniref:Glycoside hydrolase family 88 protein n=1 Tax=Flavivirga spongiicola TaxID=421621 RepID=A0ABU7XW65_9FLAO|nr:glycoside hydrolase family 88 protein [Flavivirga sp. MEBiC05379]MDO5980033.1 glycoside hydrolase family 88 protein [Flavivirga sp. MEBiC05379]
MLKYYRSIAALILIGLLMACQSKKQTNYSETDWLTKSVTTAKEQLKLATAAYEPGKNPRSIWPSGETRIAPTRDWTTGFFPGSLWYMFEISKDDFFKEQANKFTTALDTIQYFTHTHDLGFMLYTSFGNGYRLTGNNDYKTVLLNGAKTLSGRFSKTVGCIKSWDFAPYNFPVIVDNMMNLELLMWASKNANNNTYKQMALSHSDTTLANHFRADNSSYHVVNYNSETGEIIKKMTHQGYADESSWARGQAWGLYGYTMMYRETQKKEYLEQAKKIAAFIMNHPRLPKDKIPYWDFDSPRIPHAYRDVSASTIMASALLKLSTIVDDGDKYFSHAEAILKNLSNEQYLAKIGENANFILKHSTGHLPNYSEIDTPINYADYYFLEALIRYADITNRDLSKI